MRARQEDSLKVKELHRKIFLLDKDQMEESAKMESVVAAISGEKSGNVSAKIESVVAAVSGEKSGNEVSTNRNAEIY